MFDVKFSSSTSSSNWPPELAASTESPPNSCELIERKSKAATLPSFPPSSGKVVAIKVHHLVPRSHEVLHKRVLRVVTCIDFRDCSELGVRTEDEIDDGARPLELARRPIAPLQHAFRFGGLLPLRVHVEQVDEEIVRQRLGPFGENTVFGLSKVCIQGAHATNQNRHLGSGQGQQVRPIHQQLSRRSLVSLPEIVAEPVRGWLQYGERMLIGLLLRRVHAPWREGNLHVVADLLRSCLDG